MPENSKTLIMKFGGASLETPAHFEHIAALIIEKLFEYSRIVIVVSAMRGMTDHLISLAKAVHPNPPKREYDMLVSAGERISIALLAMALSLKGREAVSFTGSQSGIITCTEHAEAKILDVRPDRLQHALNAGKIVIVAGFQGVSNQKEITTLGRGGSDTTAVALGVALKAEKVEFYKDVPGIFTKDPKIDTSASHAPVLSFDEAIDIIEKTGGKVLHPRAIRLAKKNNLPLYVLSFLENSTNGTRIAEEGLPLKLEGYEV